MDLTTMDLFLILFIFLFGLMIGSFLNVCIYRIPNEQSIIKPRSRCTSCSTVLKVGNLIPVFSWMIQKGKCRYCSQKISIAYPIYELVTGLLFAACYYQFGLSVELFAAMFFVSIMIIVFAVDLKHMIIPNSIVMTGIIGGLLILVYNIYKPFAFYMSNSWWNPLAAAIGSFIVLLLIAVLSMIIYKGQEGLGMGDVKIFIPIGLFLGIELTALCLFLSSILGAVTGIFLIATGIKNRKSAIPYGPFIAISAVMVMFFGKNIIHIWLNAI